MYNSLENLVSFYKKISDYTKLNKNLKSYSSTDVGSNKKLYTKLLMKTITYYSHKFE